MPGSPVDIQKNRVHAGDAGRVLCRKGGSGPGRTTSAFTELLKQFGQLGQLMDIISGGALNQVSLFAMGITPYINSSIIMQLLTVAIPALERLQKEGEEGRKKITRITRYVTIGLALFQASAFLYATRTAMTSTLPPFLSAVLIVVSFTAGTAFIMWIGEKIDQFGIGNGISLLIFAGIVSRGPQMLNGPRHSCEGLELQHQCLCRHPARVAGRCVCRWDHCPGGLCFYRRASHPDPVRETCRWP
jgi:preprotein translocase subunit SecY